jgi:hypothetical protein
MSAKIEDPLAALASVTPEELRRRGRSCAVAKALTEHPARTDVLRYLIEESGHSAPAVSRACREVGINIHHEIIKKHRQRGCSCPAA